MCHVVLFRRGGPVCPLVVGILNLPNMGGKRTMFLVNGHMCRSVAGCWDLSTTYNVCKTLRRAHIVRPYKGDVCICGKDMIAFWRRKVYDGVGLILSMPWIDSGRARRRDDVNIYLRPGLRPPV